jgi:hypothetical protein
MLWKSPWYEDIHKALKDAKELPEYSKEELEAMI